MWDISLTSASVFLKVLLSVWARVLDTAPTANVAGARFSTGLWDECSLAVDGLDDVPISFLAPVDGRSILLFGDCNRFSLVFV